MSKSARSHACPRTPKANQCLLSGRGIAVTIPEREDQKHHRTARGSAGGRPYSFDNSAYRVNLGGLQLSARNRVTRIGSARPVGPHRFRALVGPGPRPGSTVEAVRTARVGVAGGQHGLLDHGSRADRLTRFPLSAAACRAKGGGRLTSVRDRGGERRAKRSSIGRPCTARVRGATGGRRRARAPEDA